MVFDQIEAEKASSVEQKVQKALLAKSGAGRCLAFLTEADSIPITRQAIQVDCS